MRERKQNHASCTSTNNNNNNMNTTATFTIVAIASATPTTKTTTTIGNTFHKHKQTKREARTGIPNECRAAQNETVSKRSRVCCCSALLVLLLYAVSLLPPHLCRGDVNVVRAKPQHTARRRGERPGEKNKNNMAVCLVVIVVICCLQAK